MTRSMNGGMPQFVTGAMSQVNQQVKTMGESVSNKGVVVIFVILTLMLIVVIIAFIIWRLNRSNLRGISLIKAPVNLAKPGRSDPIPASRMPALHVGQDFSFSMWLYISDFVITGKPKAIFLRKGATTTAGAKQFELTNPVVMLGNNTNKLYVCVRTNRTPSIQPDSLLDILMGTGDNRNFLISAIDYIPLQRWVNVTFTVEDNLLSLYMDGNMYTVQSLYDLNRGEELSTRKPTPLFAPCSGEIRVGNFNSSLTDSASGFISNLQFFNYALSSSQVNGISMAGPETGFSLIRSMGVPDYGVRSPIYRLDGEGSDDESS